MSAVDDERAAQLVIGALGDNAIVAIDFNLDGRKVTPAMYAEVAKAIKAKKITVMADPSLAVAAAYSPEIRVDDETILRPASKPAARPARPRPSSTAKAPGV